MNIRLSAPFRLILAALLVLSLQACATRGTEIGTSAPSDASTPRGKPTRAMPPPAPRITIRTA